MSKKFLSFDDILTNAFQTIPLNLAEGQMINGRILPSVSGGNLTVALKTLAGTDPSASNPVYVMIGGVVRSITGALSKTVNAAANTFNAGSAELATKEIDYPTLLSYNATDGVVLAFSRYFGNIYSDFSATATNEKYVACSGTNMASTDPFVVIGRFAATLSAGAGYTWSVPTFTPSNLIQRPIYESDWLNCDGDIRGFASFTTKNLVYKIVGDTLHWRVELAGVSNATTKIAILPFLSVTTPYDWDSILPLIIDNGVSSTTPGRAGIDGGSISDNPLNLLRDCAGTNWTNSGNCFIRGFGSYKIR